MRAKIIRKKKATKTNPVKDLARLSPRQGAGFVPVDDDDHSLFATGERSLVCTEAERNFNCVSNKVRKIVTDRKKICTRILFLIQFGNMVFCLIIFDIFKFGQLVFDQFNSPLPFSVS